MPLSNKHQLKDANILHLLMMSQTWYFKISFSSALTLFYTLLSDITIIQEMQRTKATFSYKIPSADLKARISKYKLTHNNDLSCTTNANVRIVRILFYRSDW